MNYSELTAWIIATLTSIGAVVAGAVTWWFQVKDKRRADARARRRDEAEELEEQAIPYRQAFREQQKELEKTRSGLDRLQVDHTEALVRIARLEADNTNCQETNKKITADNVRITSELVQAQKDIRELQMELLSAKSSPQVPAVPPADSGNDVGGGQSGGRRKPMQGRDQGPSPERG